MSAAQPRPAISRAVLLALAISLAGPFALADAAKPARKSKQPKAPQRLSLERIITKNEFAGKSAGAMRWLDDGAAYTKLEKSEQYPDFKDLVRYETATGKRSVLVPAARLVPQGQEKPLRIEGYSWSKDQQKLLIFTRSRRVWRLNTRGDYWVYDLESGRLMKIGGDAPPSSLMFAKFSPDGRWVGYVCQRNLYIQNLRNGRIRQLTSNGSDRIINGTSDWVYEEEFHLRDGFRWSPDSRHIAYWQFDTSGVREFILINYTDDLYPKLTRFKYPKVGQTNSACRIGILSLRDGQTQWIKASNDPRNHYIPAMDWAPGSRTLVFQHLNRLQNTNQIMAVKGRKKSLKTVFTDFDAAWVEAMEKFHWLEEGRSLLWLSERDGWAHLYRVPLKGKKVVRLTPGEYDVISIAGVDEGHGWVYFLASPDNPTQRYLYRVPLDGSGRLERITPKNQPGSHSYNIAPNGEWAFHTWSSFGKPPITELVHLPDHRRVRMLEDNQELRDKLKKLARCPHEFFRVDIGDGVELDGWMIKPPDFDPKRRYPLLLYVYGEPAGQTVLDRWGGQNYLWHCMLAQEGYLVASIDNRGTPAPRGRAWRKCIYRQVGILASADQAAALRALLKQRSYIDPKRVGIWGWSGGGSMSLNAIFRYPDLYRMAMAIAFVSNQRFYDTIYQERYMGLPWDNEEGYREGSPITYAHQLKGDLLLVHGTADDNVHYQSCEALVNELIRLNKPFTMMAYPNRTHSIREGPNTRRHLFELLTRFLHEHLPAGPAK